MYISRQPMRISLLGGGLDFPEYFSKTYVATLGFTINYFVYTSFSSQLPIYKSKYRIGFSQPSYHETIDTIQNPLIQCIYEYFGLSEPCEVQTLSNLPSAAGLGGSSSFCLGLLNILNAKMKYSLGQDKILELAIRFERQANRNSGGVQDQSHIANPGLNFICYSDPQVVKVEMSDFDLFFRSCALVFEKNKPPQGVKGLRGIGSKGLSKKTAERISSLAREASSIAGHGAVETGILRDLFIEACKIKLSYEQSYPNNALTKYLQSEQIEGWKYCGAPGGNAIFVFEDPETISRLKALFGDDYYFADLKFGFPSLYEI